MALASTSTGVTLSITELHDRLDSLWTAYLQHLHEYTEAQKSIQKHMSTGFLSLARANFNARDGVRRFGKDFYHEKAVALRRAQIASDEEASRLQLSVFTWTDPDLEEDEDEDEEEAKGTFDAEPKQQPSPPSTPDADTDDNDTNTPEETAQKEFETQKTDSKKKSTLPYDPLRWFGVLVPPTLRSAQNSFISAAEDAIPMATNSARAMRDVEYEIRKLRKEIKRAEQAKKP